MVLFLYLCIVGDLLGQGLSWWWNTWWRGCLSRGHRHIFCTFAFHVHKRSGSQAEPCLAHIWAAIEEGAAIGLRLLFEREWCMVREPLVPAHKYFTCYHQEPARKVFCFFVSRININKLKSNHPPPLNES